MADFDIIRFNLTENGDIQPLGIDRKTRTFMASYLSGDHLQSRDVVYWYWSPSATYIGQTNDLSRRNRQHYAERAFRSHQYTELLAIYGSAINDETLNAVEAQLIRLHKQDARRRSDGIDFSVANMTDGNLSSSMVRVRRDLIPRIWDRLRVLGENDGDKHKYVYGDAQSVLNSLLYKYSVFNDLSDEQKSVASTILHDHEKNFVVRGLAGTGKTALLTNLAAACAKQLRQGQPTLNGLIPRGQRVAVVVKGNWINNAKDIFKNYGDPAIVIKRPDALWAEEKNGLDQYGTVIVDEAQRLVRDYPKSRAFKAWMRDAACRYDNELEIVQNNAKQTILLYDPFQSIRPDDIPGERFNELTKDYTHLQLTQQFRVNPSGSDAAFSGEDFTNGIVHALELDTGTKRDYPFDKGIFDTHPSGSYPYFEIAHSIAELFDYTDDMRNLHPNTVNRVIGGYVREWKSNHDPNAFDWVEQNGAQTYAWKWNDNAAGWVRPHKARWADENRLSEQHDHEIGSIHAIQGEDFNYIGAIIGKDLEVGLDGHLHGNTEHYKDSNGTPGKADFDESEFTEYIKHVYFTILMRGIDGVRVYFEDPKVEEFFRRKLGIPTPELRTRESPRKIENIQADETTMHKHTETESS